MHVIKYFLIYFLTFMNIFLVYLILKKREYYQCSDSTTYPSLTTEFFNDEFKKK